MQRDQLDTQMKRTTDSLPLIKRTRHAPSRSQRGRQATCGLLLALLLLLCSCDVSRQDLQNLRALLGKQCADVVVMGHTHIPDRLELPEGIYANTGSCSVGQRMYVSIDTARRSVELHSAN